MDSGGLNDQIIHLNSMAENRKCWLNIWIIQLNFFFMENYLKWFDGIG